MPSRLGSGVSSLVTTRLDSDDALSANYLAQVLEAAAGWRGFINAPRGYRLCEGNVVRCVDRAGPFLSFVEELCGRSPQTVFQVRHDRAEQRGPVLQLKGRPNWLQVLHGGNLANRFCGWPADADAACADLGLEGLRERMQGRGLGAGKLARAVGGQVRHELARWVRQAPRLRSGVR